MKLFNVRLSDEDYKLFALLAQGERLPMSTMFRRMLYAHAKTSKLEVPLESPRASALDSLPRKMTADGRSVLDGDAIGNLLLQRVMDDDADLRALATEYGLAYEFAERIFRAATERLNAENDAPGYPDVQFDE